jgi:hypothetical protein
VFTTRKSDKPVLKILENPIRSSDPRYIVDPLQPWTIQIQAYILIIVLCHIHNGEKWGAMGTRFGDWSNA